MMPQFEILLTISVHLQAARVPSWPTQGETRSKQTYPTLEDGHDGRLHRDIVNWWQHMGLHLGKFVYAA